MPRQKKVIEERAVKPLEAIRLVKANEVASRAAAPESAKSGPAKVMAIRPELRRTPRNAAEARNMFDDLFKAA